jgi:DNA-binding NtrC family response regulator
MHTATAFPKTTPIKRKSNCRIRNTRADTRARPNAKPIGVNFLTLDEMCDRYILFAFNRCGRKYEAAARALGIGRTSLYRYMKNLAFEDESAYIGHLEDDFDSNYSRGIYYIPTIG